MRMKRKIITVITICMLLGSFTSCGKTPAEKAREADASVMESLRESARERTNGTFGGDSGDTLLVDYIPEDDALGNAWDEILDTVNEYRNSPEYADDDRDTRRERVSEILSGYEGVYIAEGSINTEHEEYISGRMILGGSFQILITDPEWYLLHN